MPDLGLHPDYLTNADRVRRREGLTALLTARTKMFTKADLLAACEAQGVPAGPINDLAEVFADPQIIARGMRIDPDGVPGVRTPIVFSGAELATDRPSPRLGADNAMMPQDTPSRA